MAHHRTAPERTPTGAAAILESLEGMTVAGLAGIKALTPTP